MAEVETRHSLAGRKWKLCGQVVYLAATRYNNTRGVCVFGTV